jgi:hypothetical protein
MLRGKGWQDWDWMNKGLSKWMAEEMNTLNSKAEELWKQGERGKKVEIEIDTDTGKRSVVKSGQMARHAYICRRQAG